MFQIHDAQMKAFAQWMRERAVKAVACYLEERQTVLIVAMGRELWMEGVRRGVDAALGYGLEEHRHIGWFVEMCFDLSPRFHLQPKIHQLLSDRSLEEVERIDELMRQTDDSDWMEAAEL